MKHTRQFTNQKVLVTGASGFLGSHLCRHLCMAGAEVHAIARNLPSGRDACLHWWKGDMSEISSVQDLYTAIKPDVIFHLTSHGMGAQDIQCVLPTLHSDLLATVYLLTVATQQGCSRIIVAASMEEPQPGSTEMIPTSPYAAAKSAASAYARMFHRLYRAPVVIARPFMTYGPGQRAHKIIPYVTLELLKDRAPQLSSGCREVDWVYVDDVIQGLLAAAQTPDVEGCTIDLGSGSLVPIQTVANQLAVLIGSPAKPCFGALPDRRFEQIRVADTAYAYRKLRWRAATPLEQGLAHTVEWYREQLQSSSSTKVLPS
jgi:nucleoside-diphosphate-sugar epimerase